VFQVTKFKFLIYTTSQNNADKYQNNRMAQISLMSMNYLVTLIAQTLDENSVFCGIV
jgi:hypothetical protein